MIASGGAGSLEDLEDVFKRGDASAVIVASLFHYGTVTIPETKEFLADRGLAIRQ